MQENNKNPFQQKAIQQGDNNFATDNFEHRNSYGANPKKLAQISAVYKMAMRILGWDDSLIDVITGYQASIDTKYHDDFVRIAELQHYVNTLRKSRSNATGFYSANPQQKEELK